MLLQVLPNEQFRIVASVDFSDFFDVDDKVFPLHLLVDVDSSAIAVSPRYLQFIEFIDNVEEIRSKSEAQQAQVHKVTRGSTSNTLMYR